jgi:hypothetical protein
MKTLLMLSILLAGHVEPTIVPTTSESICEFVADEMLKTVDLPVLDPAAPRIIDAHCVAEAPEDANAVPPVELELEL